LVEGQLFEYYWTLPIDDDDVINLTPGKYGALRVSRFTAVSPTTTQCQRNQAYGFNIATGSASSLALTSVTLALVALAAVIAFV
jgi:hypothetical protein